MEAIIVGIVANQTTLSQPVSNHLPTDRSAARPTGKADAAQSQQLATEAQSRQAKLNDAQQAKEATQVAARKANLAKQAQRVEARDTEQLQSSRGLVAEQRARTAQSSAELARSNQDRQDAIANARRDVTNVQRGAVVDVLA